MHRQHSVEPSSHPEHPACGEGEAKPNQIRPLPFGSLPLEQASASCSQRGQMARFCPASKLKMGLTFVKV